MPLKRTMRFWSVPARMARIWNASDTSQAARDVEQQELSFTARRMQNGAAALEDSSAVCVKRRRLSETASPKWESFALPDGRPKTHVQFQPAPGMGAFSSWP